MLGRSALVILAALAAASTSWAAIDRTEFAQRVDRICLGARLFDREHTIGTRAGAISVSRDIRRTGTRRLRRVATVPEPHAQVAVIRRWLALERRLVAAYARDYLRIWDAIERAQTAAQRAHLPSNVDALVHETDGLKRRADTYEMRLDVPDCTGGGH